MYSPVEMRRPEDPIVPIDAPSPLFYWSGRSELPISFGDDGSFRLPEVILWAFRLDEGNLLTLSRDTTEASCFRFESYTQALRTITEGIGRPWPYIEELLRLPMVAIGPRGRLSFQEEAAALSRPPGESLRLVVEPGPFQRSFRLEPAESEVSAHLCLEIRYVLPVEKGYVRVPDDLRSIASLDEKLLAYETGLGTVDFDISSEPLGNRDLTCLGPDGSLLLPKAFLRDLKAEWQVLLSASVAPKLSFRLSHYVEGPPLSSRRSRDSRNGT
jgi:hypothetical protein